MRKVLFIIAINYLIGSCRAELFFSNPVKSFLSVFGINFNANPTESEEISTESDLDDPESDSKLERTHDPLDLLIVNLDGLTLMGTVGNSWLYNVYIRSEEFVDILLACPKKDDKKTKTKNKKGQKSDFLMKTLVVEENFISIVTKYMNNEDEFAAAISKKITIDTSDDEIENGMELDSNEIIVSSNHQKNGEAGSQDSIEEESNPQKSNEEAYLLKKRIRGEESSNHTTSDDYIAPKKNKIGAIEEQGLDKTDRNEIKTPESQTETQKRDPSGQKIKTASDSLTPETEKFWIQALDDVKNFKCRKPVRAHFLLYPSGSVYKVYITGFEIFMEKENLNLPKFAKLPDRFEKFKWFWSFTIIFSEFDRNVVCVYQEVQYNQDTYSSYINENFEDHDLAKDMMFPNMNISQLYEIENQEDVFHKLFENHEIREKYFNPSQGKFLVRVHLAPLHGFVSPLVRQSGKTYGNIAPMWSSIRNGAWRTLEKYIDTLSHVLMDLVVITGTYGTLKLEDQPIYLAGHKVPVPLAFWKMVIYGAETQRYRGILIVTFNNPYEHTENVICEENQCEKFGWGNIQEEDIIKGRTICCEFKKEILQQLPILEGAQPPNVLDLKKLSLIVDDVWQYNQLGKKTSWKERGAILEMLQLKKNVMDEEMIMTDERMNESLEKEGKNKNQEEIPPLDEVAQSVAFIQKHVAM